MIAYTGGDLEAVRLDAVLSFPAGIKQAVTKPLVGSSSIDDKDVAVVEGTANGGRSSIKLYFDKLRPAGPAGALRRYGHRAGTDTGGLQ